MATKDWAYRRKAGDGRRDLVQDTVHFLSLLLPGCRSSASGQHPVLGLGVGWGQKVGGGPPRSG